MEQVALIKTRSHRIQRNLAGVAIIVLMVCSLTCITPQARAQSIGHSTLYYGMGGGTPGGGANNGDQLASNLGIGGDLRLNYACGKFDVGLSWQTLMNGFSQLGTTVTNAVKAGIASLPLYILQRAQPGLYQLFQNYSQKADLMIAASLKTCEEMEAMIKQGENPYEDWVRLAKGEGWKAHAQAGGDIVQAKYDLSRDEGPQRKGINWVFNQRAGGVGDEPIQPIRDVSIAGYNATLNKPATESRTKDYSASADVKNTRLVRAFPTPQDLADFTTEVLGDKRIYTCSQGDSDCPDPTTVTTSTGLGPKFEAEYDEIQPKLETMVIANATVSNPAVFNELQEISAPGIGITPELLQSVRELPRDMRSIAVNRLADEMAMQRVINKALIARGVLLTGMSLPEVTAAGDAMNETRETIDRLTQYIDDLMYESRIRKELTSTTALSILESRAISEAKTSGADTARPRGPNEIEDGAIKTGP